MSVEEQKRPGGLRRVGRRALAPAAIGTAALLGAAALGGLPALAAPDDDSEALGQILDSSLLTGELLDAVEAQAGDPSGPAEDVTPLNLSALGIADVDLGGGISLPVISEPGDGGLIELGNLGLLNAYAATPSATQAKASAGVVGEDGAINVDPDNPGALENSKIDLTNLFGQLDVDVITDGVINEFALELGAVASAAMEDAGAVSSEYVLADAKLDISSPLLGALSTELDSAIGGVGTTVDGLLASDGAVGSLLGDLDIDLNVLGTGVSVSSGTIGVDGLDAALTGLSNTIINEPLTDPNEIVSIDLNNGTIAVDVAAATDGGSLNGLDPNTELLDSTTIGSITTAISDALGTVTTKVTDGVTDVLNNTAVTLNLSAELSVVGVSAVAAEIIIDTTLGQLAGTAAGDPTVQVNADSDLIDAILGVLNLVPGVDLSSDELLGAIGEAVVAPVVNVLQTTLSTSLSTIGTNLSPIITGLLDPVLNGLQPLFDVLNQVVSVTINDQPTEEDPAQPGKLGAESFTVSAVSLALVGGDIAQVDLASSTVRAADEDVDVTDADVTDADVTDADVTDADVTDADVTDADVTDADVTDADVTDADVTDADVTDADVTDADVTDADVTDADVTDADVTDADVTDADVTDADVTDADVTDADVTDADVTDADVTDADVTDADVTDADVTDADVTDADVTDADVTDADVTDADVTDADATDADATDADATDADATDADATDADATDADATDADATDADATDADATDADATDADATDSDAADADATDADADGGDNNGEISMGLEHDVRMVGQEQVAYGYGFEPGETVKGTMFSDPFALGSQVADDKGEVTFTWDVPAGTSIEAHTVELEGALSGTVSAEFDVVASATGTDDGDSDGGLAVTGADIGGFLPIAGILLLAGAGLLVATRRKSTV
ncbi:choice-of-anchor G family protein [Microbacterium halotolerans]|uniref:choice-of-anchor G family protein n=1 Tax=Microbacterium halotolerans TaxID=246613 RepID=UPI0013C338C5|nr:choice-of-anchor G family protein [Microbacterium halotolerans]